MKKNSLNFLRAMCAQVALSIVVTSFIIPDWFVNKETFVMSTFGRSVILAIMLVLAFHKGFEEQKRRDVVGFFALFALTFGLSMAPSLLGTNVGQGVFYVLLTCCLFAGAWVPNPSSTKSLKEKIHVTKVHSMKRKSVSSVVHSHDAIEALESKHENKTKIAYLREAFEFSAQ
ncbi:MAG: hypothetical protein WC795_02250 [Candidatus Paceibacterota bacterium]|jgi:hypothetical protein